jgi:hypothetical protein
MPSCRVTWSCWGTRVLTIAIALAVAWEARAQDDLYGPSAPADAAWVRAINAEDTGGLGIRIGDGGLASVAFADATPYHVVAPGPVDLDVGGTVHTVEVEPTAFLTVVAAGGDIVLIEDAVLLDVSRGLLALYNLTQTEALHLVVVDGPEVVTDVAPWSQAAVTIAEAEVALEVRAGDDVIATLEAQHFARGVAHAVLVVEGPDGPLVRYVAAVAVE